MVYDVGIYTLNSIEASCLRMLRCVMRLGWVSMLLTYDVSSVMCFELMMKNFRFKNHSFFGRFRPSAEHQFLINRHFH